MPRPGSSRNVRFTEPKDKDRVPMPRAMFYFDLGSPYAYLAAERITTLLPEPLEWRPVLLGGLFKLAGRSSWALGDYRRREVGMAEIERRARLYGLAPMQWPDPWPSDYLVAMRATTFAFALGRGRRFTQHAFRNAFRRGADLSITANVLESAGQVGVERHDLEAAIESPQIKQSLREATDAAFELGVFGVPTVAVDGELFWGDDRLEEAAAHLKALPAG
jgi:2-hydroxychromene-2-carboxylate isomerase